MVTYILRQFIYSILIIFGVMTVTFILVRVLPAGDPARLVSGQRTDIQTIESIRRIWKLDRPIYEQYGDFLSKAMHGDLGRSFATNLDVRDSIIERCPATALLAFGALAIATIMGITIGVISAWKSNTVFDYSSMVLALLGISVPVFVLGIFLLIINKWLGWFGSQGYIHSSDGWDFSLLILPLIALAARPLSIIARITRSSMLEVLSQDYIRTARAKGLPIGKTIIKHALRNALNPVITTISAWLAGTLAGTVFIEQIFGWPGIGRLAFQAVFQLDFPMIQGTVLFTAVVFVIVNFLVDIIYSMLDPKVRLS
ncbi:MAG: ABC transporter permease [Candidatus Kapaibacterium sp.]